MRDNITPMRPMEDPMPHDNEAEEGVLGCLLINPASAAKVADYLTPDDFHRDDHSLIFDAAISLYKRGKECNETNVMYELRRRGQLEEAGGVSRLNLLPYSLATLRDISDHADTLKEVATNRKLAIAGYEIFKAACKKGTRNLLEQAEKMIYDISLGASADTVSTMTEVMLSYMAELEVKRDNFSKNIANGIPTGFTDLDRMLGGLQPADLIILAARPSLGKTALAVNMALNIVQKSKHALFFSLEMKKEAIAQRLVAMETPMDQTLLRDGDVTDSEMEKIIDVAGALSQTDFRVDDRTRLISEIRSKARRVHSIKKLDVILVDYLQLIRSGNRDANRNRAEEVAELSHQLKELAMELNVPVVALAQLNRAIETRQQKTPIMSDLKESGAIEQDADVIMFLHCSDEELEKRNQCLPYQIDIVVGKQRNGRVGQISLVFRPRSTKFQDQTVENVYVIDEEDQKA